MTNKESNIREIKLVPNQQVIDLLESFLMDAKSGILQGVAIAGILNNCETVSGFVADFYPSALIGEMRILERDIIDLNVDIRRQVAWEYTE